MSGALPRPRAGPAVRHAVLAVRPLGGNAFVLRFSREGLAFAPGQWINVGLPRLRAQREYSIYSGTGDDYLEILAREIPDGALTPALRRLAPGDTVEVDGPHGSFTLVEGGRAPVRYLFCATGTGISPFHAMSRSRPDLDFLLLHGVRSPGERYDHGEWEQRRVVTCVSGPRAGAGTYAGRLTAWLRENGSGGDRYCYLCGNSDMIYEAYGILAGQGVAREQLFAEVYF